MIPRPLGCDGDHCDYGDGGVWVHVDCELAASPRGASEIRHPAMAATRRHLKTHPLPAPRRTA